MSELLKELEILRDESKDYLEEFGNIFFDESLTEQLLEIANSKFYGC